MPTYYYSDTNETFTGSGSSDVLDFDDDTGTFDWRTFSFCRYGDDLLIGGNNGYTATVTNHFLNTTARVETLSFNGGASTIDLTAGNLLILDYVAPSGSEVWGSGSADLILGGIPLSVWSPSTHHGNIWGQGGDDTIIANYIQNIYGGDGNDTIYSGARWTYGDDGNDTIYISEIPAMSALTLIAYGGNGNDVIHGNDYAQHLFGDAGNDILYGYGGNDSILGGDGNDEIYGDDGNDSISGGTGDNLIYGGAGNDSIYAGSTAGDDNIIYGGDGDDNIQVSYGNDFVSGGDGNDTISAGAGADIVYGGAGNDTILTTSLWYDDFIYGEGGDDKITFQATAVGSPYLYGGSGNDTYQTDIYPRIGPTYIFDESGSNDTLILQDGLGGTNTFIFTVSGNNLIVTHPDSTGSITITDHFAVGHHIENFKIVDVSNPSTVYHELSAIEELTSGNDNYTATYLTSELGSDHNIVDALDGDDVVHAGIGNDVIYGGYGNDTLYGESGNDYLDGALGDDILYGGDGADTLFGGGDTDIFVFEAATAFNNVDTVNDFSPGDGDALDISDILDGFYDPLTDLLTDFVQITDSGGNSIVSVDQNGGADNFVQIATLLGITGLTDEAALETAGNLITSI